MALAGGTGVSAWQAVRATAAERGTAAALAETQAEKDRAEAALVRVTEEQKAAGAARLRTLAALRAMTDEATLDRQVRQGALTDGDKKSLAATESLWAEFADAGGDTEDGRAVRAEGLFRGGELREDLEDRPGAERKYLAAKTVLDGLVADFPANPAHAERWGNTLLNLGVVYAATARPAEAERAYRDAIACYWRLAAAHPSDPRFRDYLARCRFSFAVMLVRTGRPAEAEPLCREAIAAQRQLAAEFPAKSDHPAFAARALTALGEALKATGRRADAETANRDAVALLRALAKESPRSRSNGTLATALVDLAVLVSADRAADARGLLAEALALRRQEAADFPHIPGRRYQLAALAMRAGGVAANDGRSADAERAYREAVAVFQQLAAEYPQVGIYSRDLATSHLKLGRLHMITGRRETAAKLLAAADGAVRAGQAADPPDAGWRGVDHEAAWLRLDLALTGGDHPAVAAGVGRMVETAPDPSVGAFYAAVFLCRCVRLPERDAAVAGPVAAVVAGQYAEWAMAYLRRAEPLDEDRRRRLRNGSDFDPLRGRLDFRWLQAKYDARKPQ